MGAMVFSAEENCGFFGPSSNFAFTRHISRPMARTSPFIFPTGDGFSPGIPLDNAAISISQPASLSARNSSSRQILKHLTREDVKIYALPLETTTRNLISRYFGDTGLLFPYIDEQAFLDTYNEINANDFTKIRTWLGLLNMIMAMATCTIIESCVSAEKRAKGSDIYYQRATGLCEKQIMRGTSLEIVQYLLLTGQYLQGTQRSVEAWTVHGLAVKGAFQLGLHSSAASSRFSSLDQEPRKRTWYACVVLDRTLSMTFGRPAAIPDDYIRISLPQSLGPEESGDSHELANDPKQEVNVAFFNATITLHKIMWKVINQLYGANIGCGPQTTVLDTVS
ncbi:putative C6 transcription factor [Rhexocercosporidium sp. MPI-PUGE-AT-0058]|nr:putative C6 transcription factor [Rhexocercosporidium sp. MPI-PUGE-AT-0058]